MSQSPSVRKRTWQICGILLTIAIVVWLLRGFGILTFIPGGIVGLLLLLAIAMGIFGILWSRWHRF